MDELYEKIQSIELMELSDYMIEQIFDYTPHFAKTTFKIGIEGSEKLKKHYSEVLKILLVYLGLEKDIGELNEQLKKNKDFDIKKIGAPISVFTSSIFQVLKIFLMVVWIYEFSAVDASQMTVDYLGKVGESLTKSELLIHLKDLKNDELSRLVSSPWDVNKVSQQLGKYKKNVKDFL